MGLSLFATGDNHCTGISENLPRMRQCRLQHLCANILLQNLLAANSCHRICCTIASAIFCTHAQCPKTWPAEVLLRVKAVS